MNLEQIRARRGAIALRLGVLAAFVADESRTLTEPEVAEATALELEDKALESTETILSNQAARAAAAARPVAVGQLPRPAAPATAGPARPAQAGPHILSHTREQLNGDKFLGQTWARLGLARIRAALAFKAGTPIDVQHLLAQAYPHSPHLAKLSSITDSQRMAYRQRKASGIEGGGITTGEQGAELLELDSTFTGDFITFLYSQTIFDRLGFRQMPVDVTVKGMDGAFTGYFVGEKKPIPVSIGSFSTVNLRRFKAAGLTYLSRDLIERSAPAAEPLFVDGVTQAITQAIDTKAFSTDAASAGVNSAGLLNGLAGTASVGGRVQDVYTDDLYLTNIFVAAKNNGGLKYVSGKVVANQIAHLLSPLTATPVFTSVSADGGTLHGKPYVTGENFPASNLILIKPSDVWVVGDSGVSVELSTEATIEADTAPTGEGLTPAAQSANMVSMFQTDMVAIRAIRDIDWSYRRAQAIVTARLTAVKYDGTQSTTD
jgi:hypothetical protein